MKTVLHWLLHRVDLERRQRLGVAILNRAISGASREQLGTLLAEIEGLALSAEDQLRRISVPVGAVRDWEGRRVSEDLTYQVQSPLPPWKTIEVPRLDVPGMLTDEEIRYYHYVSCFYGGAERWSNWVRG